MEFDLQRFDEGEQVNEPEEPLITREQYQAALDDAKQLRERLAEFQRQPQIQQQQQPQQSPMFTPETVIKIDEAIQLQAQQFQAAHTAAIKTYNEFVQKEFAEPDFREVQRFATNEFFEQLPRSD